MDERANTQFIALLRKAMDNSVTAPEAQAFLTAAGKLLAREGTSVDRIRFRSFVPTMPNVVSLPTLQDKIKEQEGIIAGLRAELSEMTKRAERAEQENERLAESRLRGDTKKYLPFWSHVTARLGTTYNAKNTFVMRYNAFAERKGLDPITEAKVTTWGNQDEVPPEAVAFARSPWLTRPTAGEKEDRDDWSFEEDRAAEELAAMGKTSNQIASILTKRFGRKVSVGAGKKALQRCRIRDAVLQTWDQGERDLGKIRTIAAASPDVAAYDITDRKVRRIIGILRNQPHLLPRQAMTEVKSDEAA